MELIDKSALVAEIKKRRKLVSDPILSGDDLMIGERNALFDLLSFIDTLEVKEVDLEKELDEWTKYGPHTNYPWCTIPDAIKITAEHFFELGLKVNQKGE